MTDTQQKYRQIWQTIQAIPAGKVASYGKIADLAGLPGRARLVGKALREAPKDMKLPWYRVLKSSGHLAFPIGSEYFERQKALLQEENIPVTGSKVPLKQVGWEPDLGELLAALNW